MAAVPKPRRGALSVISIAAVDADVCRVLLQFHFSWDGVTGTSKESPSAQTNRPSSNPVAAAKPALSQLSHPYNPCNIIQVRKLLNPPHTVSRDEFPGLSACLGLEGIGGYHCPQQVEGQGEEEIQNSEAFNFNKGMLLVKRLRASSSTATSLGQSFGKTVHALVSQFGEGEHPEFHFWCPCPFAAMTRNKAPRGDGTSAYLFCVHRLQVQQGGKLQLGSKLMRQTCMSKEVGNFPPGPSRVYVNVFT